MSEIEVPKGWSLEKLSNICEKITSGGTPSRNNSEYFGGNIPWLKIGDLNNDLIINSEERITKKGLENSSAKLFPKNTILIAMYGATIGKTGHLGIEAATNQAICAMFCSEKILPEFLHYFLKSKYEFIRKQAEGAAQPNINQDKIKNLQILLPPLETQKKIVQKLDYVLGQLEEKKRKILDLQKTTRYEKLVKSQKQAIIDYYFSQTSEKMKYSEVKRLNEISTVIPGVAFKSEEFIQKDGISVITIANVGHGFFINNEKKFLPAQFSEKYSRFLVMSNYILLALTRPFTDDNTLKVCKYPVGLPNSLLNQRVAMLIPSKKIDVDFILFQMQTTEFKKQITMGVSTSLQPNLSSTKLPLFTLRISNYELQLKISKEIKQKLDLVENLSTKIQSIQKIKSNLLQRINSVESEILNSAFLGKLVN